ncbi:MAG: hypothetical protein ABJL72_12145 [Roseobacter sp.]
MHNDIVSVSTAGTWISSPFWMEYLEPTYQALLALGGFILLVLTIRNKWLDLKIKRAKLAEIDNAAHEIQEVGIADGR